MAGAGPSRGESEQEKSFRVTGASHQVWGRQWLETKRAWRVEGAQGPGLYLCTCEWGRPPQGGGSAR